MLLKQDKLIRSQIDKKIREEIGDDVESEKLTNALGFSFSDVDDNLQLEVVDTPEYYELLQKSEVRDAVIDSMIVEQAKLKSIQEQLIYDMLKIKIDNEMLTYEELNSEQKYIFDTCAKFNKELEEEMAQKEVERKE